MAPQVNGSVGSGSGSGTSIALTLPSSIVAQELLVLFTFCAGATAPTNTAPWGAALATTGSASIGWMQLWCKTAAGSDTATLTPNGSQSALWLSWRLSGWTFDESQIAVSFTNQAGGGGSPNPPSLAPALVRDSLWFVAGCGAQAPTLTAPTNYSSISQANLSTAACIAVARRQQVATSDDPAAFGNGGTITNTMQGTVMVPGLNAQAPPMSNRLPRARMVRASYY